MERNQTPKASTSMCKEQIVSTIHIHLILTAAQKGASNRTGGAQNQMLEVGVYGSNPNLSQNNNGKIDIQSKITIDLNQNLKN